MRYTRFILYYPDEGLYGGEATHGDDMGAEESGSASTGGVNENIENISNGMPVGDKEITSLIVQDHTVPIIASGDSRVVKISGTRGAKFTLTIKDSSGCSIMDKELSVVEIPEDGKYTFIQEFPSIEGVTTQSGSNFEEYYEVVITPTAGVKLNGELLKNGTPTFTLYQYQDPTITLATTSSQSSPALSVAVSGLASKKGKAGGYGDSNGEASTNWILTITEDSATDGNFYIKNSSFNDNITTNSVIKKVVDRNGESPTTGTLNLKPLTTRAIGSTTSGAVTKGNDDFPMGGELAVGMTVKCNIEKTKIVTNSLEVPSCKRKTDKFELSDTTDLFEGMWLYIDDILITKVKSIDCSRNITVTNKVIIEQNRNVVFKYNTGAIVNKVISQANADGNACVTIDRYAYIPDGVELEFEDNGSILSGNISSSTSGDDSVVLTCEVFVVRYGYTDVTYTLDLDNIITRKPNARDYDIEVNKNTLKSINLIIGDFDANKTTKTAVITQPASHGTHTVYDVSDSGYNNATIDYTPMNNFVGDDVIKYQLKDNDRVTDLSDEKTIRITVK